ncbi:MAG: MATE family efflux transporter [Eubacteriales bacterium]|nr:MATE family efflux transporter [Eubacteriales bacterium]
MNRYFGDRRFYRAILAIAVPIMIQNGITNFVSLLDNIMVGRIGTLQMSSVSIVNQLIFVYNLCIFGGLSGAGIFSSQYAGKGDMDGLRYTTRFKLYIGIVLTLAALLLFGFRGDQLIGLYLQDQSNPADAAQALIYGREYLLIMMLGLPPFFFTQAYASTLRETGETVLPMKAGITAVIVNLVLNYILIFGSFGAPRLGIAGAAIATIISRYVECFIVVIWTHRHSRKFCYVIGLYRSLRLPSHLILEVVKKGTPLLINETLWSGGMAMLLQSYSVRGLSVIAAMNISSTLSNIFNIVFISLGSTVSILVGQHLGSGRMEEAKLTATRMMVFSALSSAGTGLLMVAFHRVFPLCYNTTDEVRQLAASLIMVTGLLMPLPAFTNATYFTLRSGGKTIITFLFDSVFVWIINVPCAYLLSRYTTLPIVLVYLTVQSTELLKCTIGYIMVKKGIWLNNIINE